jgi:alanine racemase
VEMDLCLNHKIEPVIHSMYQFEEIDKYLQTEILTGVGRVWVKFNSGMNRLGLDKEQVLRVYGDLHRHPETEVVFMSHLACADDPESQSAVELTQRQIAEFDSLKQQIENSTQGPVQAYCHFPKRIINSCGPGLCCMADRLLRTALRRK